MEIIIVGMARSGTTAVTHLLGSCINVHVEIEPHMLWKSGHFSMDDEPGKVDRETHTWIRTQIKKASRGKVLIEKSPPNSLRPELVKEVFPNAKIVYITRDPIRCIHSNINRSLTRDAGDMGIVLRKYLYYTGKKDLPNSVSSRSLFSQIRVHDYPSFLRYAIQIIGSRYSNQPLPFGPRIKNYRDILKLEGLIGYHVAVYRKTQAKLAVYKELFQNSIATFRFEDIMTDRKCLESLIQFCNLEIDDAALDLAIAQLNPDRITNLNAKGKFDDQIGALLRVAPKTDSVS
jgi:hypothetical protein